MRLFNSDLQGVEAIAGYNEMFALLCTYDVVCSDRDLRVMLGVNQTLEDGPSVSKSVSLFKLAKNDWLNKVISSFQA